MADIFAVIADPTRRELLRLLLDRRPDGGESSVGELVTALGLSQPTVSKHLRVLRDAGLVHVREEGQHRFYSVDQEPLAEVSTWLAPFLGVVETVPQDARDLASLPPWTSPVPVPAPLRRAAENLPAAGDVGTSLGRAVAQAQSRILDPMKKRLGRADHP